MPSIGAYAAEAESFERPTGEAVREKAVEWISAKKLPADNQNKAKAIWADLPQDVSGTELLSRLALTFAQGDQRAAALVDICTKPREPKPVAAQDWLLDKNINSSDPFFTANLRLFFGRWLVRQAMYEEARSQLADLRTDDVVDPDSLLFFQAVAHHQLMEAQQGLAVIKRLLKRGDDCPRRYRSVALLMQSDLEGLKEDSLDHIARRMDDVRRRLDLGRPGDKTRKVEDGIIESLDKQIKKLEDQQNQSSQSSDGSGNNTPTKPADDARLLSGKGSGKVTQRDVGSDAGWGNLPAKDREAALQQVNREFPAHYREVIEQYFRKLADKEE